MVTKIRSIPAGRFKARCLALLDEVARSGRPLIVTKRGRPVAKLVALDGREARPLRGSILSESDVVSPLGEAWEAER